MKEQRKLEGKEDIDESRDNSRLEKNAEEGAPGEGYENEETKNDDEVKKKEQELNDSESDDDYVEDEIKRKLREYKLE